MNASGQAFAGLEVPEQFKSTNAAVILGLDKDPILAKENSVLTKKMVKEVAQKLFRKFHPDLYMDFPKYSGLDRERANEITRKVISARLTLENWLESHPDFNPYHQNMEEGPSPYQGTKKENYSWADVFGERETRATYQRGSSTRDIVTEEHFGGTSMRGTLFEFLQDYPGFNQAFIPLNVKSTDINDNMDALMIIDPEIFPMIEIKYISKYRDSQAPQLVESVFAKYVRGHHVNGTGSLTDGIVLPSGNYLMDPLKTGRPPRILTAKPMDSFGKKLMIDPIVANFFLEIKPTGYSSNRSYTVVKNDQKSILPRSNVEVELPVPRLPGWKNIDIPNNEGVILLGYEPPKNVNNVVTADFIKERKLKFAVSSGKLDTDSLELLNHALNVIVAAAPAKFSAEASSKGPFDFIIEVTDSVAAKKDIVTHRAQGAILNSTADAYTMVLADHPKGPFVVRLLWDKIAFETDKGKWVERPDAFVRMLAALGHEIYGNVRSFSERSKILLSPQHRYSDKFVESDQIKFELAAFRAGTETLDRLINQAKSDPQFPEKTLKDLRAALKREHESLASWRKAALESGSAGSCRQLLGKELGTLLNKY